MEIVAIYGHLVIDRCQSVGCTQRVGYERCIINSLGHIPFVAREDEHMVEVEVARLQYTHHLDTSCRFAMKGYGGDAHQLGDESAEDGQVGIKVTVCNEFGKLLQRSEHAENRLLEEWGLAVGTTHCHTARHLCKPLCQL